MYRVHLGICHRLIFINASKATDYDPDLLGIRLGDDILDMPMKPFRPPLIRRLENASEKPKDRQQDVRARPRPTSSDNRTPISPSSKRRRIGDHESTPIDVDDSGYATGSSEKQLPDRRVVASPSKSHSQKLPFKKLSVIKTPLSDMARNSTQNGSGSTESDDETYYNVLWYILCILFDCWIQY